MAKTCFKDKERACDESCEAFCSDPRHGTNCLDLAVRIESNARKKEAISSQEENRHSRDLHSYMLNSFVKSSHALRETIQNMMR
jgi:hypothetical protein